MTLRVVRHSGADAFLERAGGWLEESEAENNLVLGIAARLSAGDHSWEHPIYLATVEDDDGVVGCAWRTPPHKVGLTRMPPEAGSRVAADLADVYDELPAVLGEEAAAVAFAVTWASARGVGVRPGMRQRIHRLGAVEPPERRPPGAARAATDADRELVGRWWRAFEEDAGVPLGRDPDATVARRIRAGHLWLWEDRDPVSLAGVSAWTPRGVRVGPVYTPPGSRRKGYATALVADLSQRMLDGGREFCFLYTDLANPTSNSIYAAVGYRPVCDVRDFEFVDPGAAGGGGGNGPEQERGTPGSPERAGGIDPRDGAGT